MMFATVAFSHASFPSFPLHPTEKCLARFRAANHGGLAVSSSSPSSIDNFQCAPPKIRKNRIFFLDVNPISYTGTTRSSKSFTYWLSLLLSEVANDDPIIAVFDGNGANNHRRALLPSYKSHRQINPQNSPIHRPEFITETLEKHNVPTVTVDGHEADDVVATLTDKAVAKGYKVVIASPDKDFKQLISDDVQLVVPIGELKRWSFYTIKHYIAQYNCHPQTDLSLRCIIGDDVDNIPGIQSMVPGFGRKTALKLVKKHGSLDKLLKEASVRTVAKQYAQDALNKHADFLRRNYNVLALKRNVDVNFDDQWLNSR